MKCWNSTQKFLAGQGFDKEGGFAAFFLLHVASPTQFTAFTSGLRLLKCGNA